MRIAPGDSVANARDALARHLEKHVAVGCRAHDHAGRLGEPTLIDATGPAYDAARAAFAEAWDGTAPIDMGVGGSIPFIAEFLDAFPEASVLVTGVEDPDTRAHGANEGLHLAEFERVVHAEALLLQKLGELVGLQRVTAYRKHCGSTVRTCTVATSGSSSRSSRIGSRSSSPTRVLCS